MPENSKKMKPRSATQIRRAAREFTDREEPRAAFWKEYAALKEEMSGEPYIHVLHYYGIGVIGKTSLLNSLYPQFSQATGEISKKISRGKHTTRVTELFKIGENTYIGDTPGFSMVDVVGFNLLTFEGLLSSFPDIEKYAVGCKYTDCTHVCEDGCNVMYALSEGNVEKTRHESFVTLYKELKNVKPWSQTRGV